MKSPLCIVLVVGGIVGSATSGVLLDCNVVDFRSMMRVLIIGCVFTCSAFACTLAWSNTHLCLHQQPALVGF